MQSSNKYSKNWLITARTYEIITTRTSKKKKKRTSQALSRVLSSNTTGQYSIAAYVSCMRCHTKTMTYINVYVTVTTHGVHHLSFSRAGVFVNIATRRSFNVSVLAITLPNVISDGSLFMTLACPIVWLYVADLVKLA